MGPRRVAERSALLARSLGYRFWYFTICEPVRAVVVLVRCSFGACVARARVCIMNHLRRAAERPNVDTLVNTAGVLHLGQLGGAVRCRAFRAGLVWTNHDLWVMVVAVVAVVAVGRN